MRWLILLLPFVSFALDNAARVYPGATQSGRPFSLAKSFAPDEICGYPQPRIAGVNATAWQSTIFNRWPASAACPGGSVKRALIAVKTDVTNGVERVIEFVNSTDACHLGNVATCEAAALDEAGMLAFNGGTWDATMNVEADVTIGAIDVTKSARTMLDAGHFTYRIRGPVLTQVLVEDRTSARSQDFGFRRYRTAKLLGDIGNNVTTIPADAMHWVGIARPFKIAIEGQGGAGSEIISICYVHPDTGYLYVGTTNGSNSTCSNSAGRAQDGTSQPYAHYKTSANAIHLDNGVRMGANTYSSATSFTVNDASSISAAAEYRAGSAVWRVCNKSGNTLTAGTAAWGCAAASLGTRRSGMDAGEVAAHTPFVAVADDYWIAATNDATKSLHPVFILSFFDGWAGVGIEYFLENAWTDRSQDQDLDITFATNAGTLASFSGVRLVARSRLKYPDGPVVGTFSSTIADRKAWTGTAPAAVRMDYNLAHLRASRVLPYDPTVTITQGLVTDILTNGMSAGDAGTIAGWDSGNLKCGLEIKANLNTVSQREGSGGVMRGWPAPGGRPELGLNNGLMVAGLYAAQQQGLTGANRWEEWTFGMAACGGYFPLHMLEGDNSKTYCNPTETDAVTSCTAGNASASAFGKHLTVDAHPVLTANNTEEYLEKRGLSTTNFWGVGDGTAHYSETQYLAWALTGDPYYEWNLHGSAWWALYTSVAYPDTSPTETNPYFWRRNRRKSWGLAACMNGCRTASWHQRALGHAWMASADGTPEQQYYAAKLTNYAAFLKGKWGIASGTGYVPCQGGNKKTSPWCFGNQLYTPNGPQWASVDVPAIYDGGEGNTVNTWVYGVQSYWMDNYGRVAHGFLHQAGFTNLADVMRQTAAVQFRRLLDMPNPFNQGEYRDPNISCYPEANAPFAGGCGARTWALGEEYQFSGITNWWNGFNSTVKNRVAYENDGDLQHGYSNIFQSTLMFLDKEEFVNKDGVRVTGKRVIEASRRLNRYQRQRARSAVAWAFSPASETEVPIRVNVSGTSATVIIEPPDGGACTYWEGTTWPTQSITSGETSVPAGARERKISLSGLSAGTHYIRATCGNARGLATFTI